MKTSVALYCGLSLLLSCSIANANNFYKWKDARGNTQYGDKPPANANAKPVELPKITVIENYGEQWKPRNSKNSQTQKEVTAPTTADAGYSKLEFLAPKVDQGIRANNGDVSVIVSIQPPLKEGHSIVFSIDGKDQEKGTSRTKNFSNLDRGGHTVGVKIIDNEGKTLKSSSVAFSVLRV